MKNSVFRADVDTKAWFIAAFIRAIKTIAQTVLAMIPVAVAINSIDWQTVLATALTAGILSIATSIVGIPEVPAVGEKADSGTTGRSPDVTTKPTNDNKTE